MRARQVFPLVVALALGGCIIPSLTDLEGERERTCDGEHPCLSGYLCVAGVCKVRGSVDCTPADTRACGEARGECRQGTQTCSEAGAWGACTGAIGPLVEVCDGKDNDCDGTSDEGAVTASCGVDAGVCRGKDRVCSGGVPELSCSAVSFGADYEATETRCDGLDNDCDGLADESLPAQPCEKTQGVCAGATRTCTGGSLPTCPAATYLARDPAYEALESSCDGKDNDCDGLTDSWAPRLVTDGGSPVRRKAVAAVVPGTGSAARRDVLTLYEEGNRVLAQLLLANGTLSQPRFPSVTITSVVRASGPALGSDGTDLAEAWFEEVQGPPNTFRLAVAAAGPAGEAMVMGSPGVSPVPLPGPGQEVAVGVSAARIVLAYAYLDAPGVSTSTVAVTSCPRALDTSCTTRTLGAGQKPSLLLLNDVALVVYESGTRLSLAKLSVPAAGTVTLSSNIAFGGSNEHDPVIGGNPAAVDLYSLVPGMPETMWRRRGDCTSTCDPANFTSTPSFLTLSGTGSALALDVNGTTRLLAWEDGPAGQRSARVMDLSDAGTLEVSPPSAPGRRPVPVLSGTAGFDVLYDSDDEVLTRRFCGP